VPFFRVLYLARVRREGNEKLWWAPSKKELFGVKSFYSAMGCHDGVRFLWKSVWRTKVLLGVAFFDWLVVLGKILTMDNLQRWHVIVVYWCCLCKKNGESMDHLLLYCEVVCAIWNLFFS
jgi:hypothetical protein